MSNYSNPFLTDALRRLQISVRPKVFVSYHHGNDQAYADRFARLFDDTYDVLTDRSLDDQIDSDNVDYVFQRIRDEFISGTSCTIVLCGAETMNRKYVDWEIKATLDKKHALLGVALPTAPRAANGNFIVPSRLHANIQTGYARWMQWTDNAQQMVTEIKVAIEQARNTGRIDNSADMMGRNR